MNTLKGILLTAFFICATIFSRAQVRLSYYNYYEDTSYGGALKGNIKKMTEYYLAFDVIRVVYTCDVNEGTETAMFYEADNSLLCMWVLKFDAKGRILDRALYCGLDTLCKKETYKFDAYGREIERHTVGQSNDRCHMLEETLHGYWVHWLSGPRVSITSCKREYDNMGRLQSMKTERFVDSDTPKSVNVITYKYDAGGDKIAEMKDESSTKIDGVPDTTVDITVYKYDSKSNKVEEDLLLGNPSFRNANWYNNGEEITSKTIFRYDSHNNLIEKRKYYIDANDEHFKSIYGWRVGSGSEYTYDSLNNMTSESSYYLYRQVDGKETKDEFHTNKIEKIENNAEEKKEYDEHGNIIKVTGRTGTIILMRQIEYF